MAREYKQPSIVSGLKIQDILDMDVQTFNKLNLKELRAITGRLVSAGNKRISSFEKAGERSPAVGRLTDKEGTVVPFSTKGKNLNQLRAEFSRAKSFLQDKTSTIRGWKKVKSATIAKLAAGGINITSGTFDKFWKAYEKLKSLNPSVEWRKLKYSTLKDINDYMMENEEADPEEIAAQVEDRIASIYEKIEEEETKDNGVSDFFDIE